MADIPKGFIRVAAVGREYKTSRSTVDRRRAEADDEEYQELMKHFVLQTRDGVTHRDVSRNRSTELKKSGLQPMWFVSRAWLKKEYGRRGTGEESGGRQTEKPAVGGPIDNAILDSIKKELAAQYEKRIEELKDQLVLERSDKEKVRATAQEDKRIFAGAVATMGKVLELPGMADALMTANRMLDEGDDGQGTTGVETEDADQSATETSATDASSPDAGAKDERKQTTESPAEDASTSDDESAAATSKPWWKRTLHFRRRQEQVEASSSD